MDVEAEKKPQGKITGMPKAVIFILISIFFERYTSGGIAATMSLFFNRKLGFNPSVSTALFHTYECLVFSFSIIGAIIADSWLGLYKTLVVSSFIYSIGIAFLSISNIEPLNLPITVFTLVGLIVAVVGVGSIKSNSNTFAANQYKLPEQKTQLGFYFSMQYVCMKSGSIIGRFFNPILRQDVKCFGSGCFPLAFGVPSIAMILSMIAIICGRSFYSHKALSGNMFVKVCACILCGIRGKFTKRKLSPREHWLDYAEEKFGPKLVMETKMVLNALLMFVPVPIFWTLHMQQGSRWVFQATRMNGDIGFYTIKPDQMILFNSIFSLLLVPLFERVFYPLLARVGIKTSLQKMSCGLFCAAASFVAAAIVERKIERNFIHILYLTPQYAILASGEVLLYVQNLNFAYNEAPANMKSVMLSFVYLTMATGNLFMVFISGMRIFESQVYEFLFFAGLMVVSMLLFIVLAVNYKYVKRDESLDKQ